MIFIPKFRNPRILFLLLILPLCHFESSAFGDKDSIEIAGSAKFRIHPEGVQIDASYLIFVASASAAIDVNAFEITRKYDRLSVGVRGGVIHFTRGDAEGSPWTDLDLLMRASLMAPNVGFDLYAGVARRTSYHSLYDYRHLFFKYGGEAKWFFVSKKVGGLLRIHLTPDDPLNSHSIGIGLVIYIAFSDDH